MGFNILSWRPSGLSTFLVVIAVQLVLVTHFFHCSSSLRRGFTSPAAVSVAAASLSHNDIPYQHLAKIVQEKLSNAEPSEEEIPSIFKLTKTLSKLASNQQTFKSLDGAAHEAYQRTHYGDGVADTSVSGRAQRSAARLAAVAEALYACELIEIVENPIILREDKTFQQKELILNVTIGRKTTENNRDDSDEDILFLSVLVIYEPFYDGGMGLNHGSILSLSGKKSTSAITSPSKSKNGGRLLVVLGDCSSSSSSSGTTNNVNLTQRIRLLSKKPQIIKLSNGLVTNEVVSVQPTLYKTAGEIIDLLEPQLRHYNASAVHFVGHSLAGGVASLAACILDGVIPTPKIGMRRKVRKKRKKKITTRANEEEKAYIIPDEDTINSKEGDVCNKNCSKDVLLADEKNQDEEVIVHLESLNGLGRSRSSALTLGAPPCLSSNVVAAFCTSFMYGDDIVCRTTEDSISRLVKRIEKNLHVGFVGKKFGWMSDTLSLTVSSLQSHAHGSEGEEARLSIPGRAYLVRPRRLGGICSIHEVGNLKKGGREALREALLWQMNDVLLSTSMWKHHSLKSYIQGLDRTQLRGVADD